MKSVSNGADSNASESATIRARPARVQLCIQDLISAQAKRTPDAIALVACGERLTYAQMEASSNQVARFLRAKGVGPKTLVGVCLKRSVELVVAMLGILKAGGAYVPLDPKDPAERHVFQLQDSGATFVVTADDLAGSLSLGGTTVVRLDSDWPAINRESATNLAPSSSLADRLM